MMAYENTNLNNNAPFVDHIFDAFEASPAECKLESASNLPVGGLASQLQPGFLQQFNNANTQQQMNTLANLQMQINFLNNNSNNNNVTNNNCSSMNTNMCNMNNQSMQSPMTMNGFPQTSLMKSMAMQQPFFQQQQQQQQQEQRSVPSFISFQNDSDTPKPLLATFEPKPLFGNMEQLNRAQKNQLPKSEPPMTTSICPSVPRSVSKSKRLLPADFHPSGNYVICGNKRKYFESKGNIRFREVCKVFLQEYVQAPTKIEKSAVVTKVMNILREDCPEGAFVSPQGGRWYAVSERTAREKVGTFFRDCLSDSYKSSAKNKIARRKIVKQANSANNSANNSETNFSDDGSLESISFYDVDDLTPVPL